MVRTVPFLIFGFTLWTFSWLRTAVSLYNYPHRLCRMSRLSQQPSISIQGCRLPHKHSLLSLPLLISTPFPGHHFYLLPTWHGTWNYTGALKVHGECMAPTNIYWDSSFGLTQWLVLRCWVWAVWNCVLWTEIVTSGIITGLTNTCDFPSVQRQDTGKPRRLRSVSWVLHSLHDRL